MSQPLVATYRLQFREGTTFGRAAELAGYLQDLGVSHLYASPIFAATPGSTHGYDLVDYNAFEPDLGGADGFTTISDALAGRGLGLILDFVPNHMGISPANPWWEDVLRWGRDSAFAGHFDIVWSAPRLLLPMLPKPYGDALADGDFAVVLDRERGELRFQSGGFTLPLDPRTYPDVLERMDHPERDRLMRSFAVATAAEASTVADRFAGALRNDGIGTAVGAAVDAVNADPSAVHALHERQAWRLVWWRAGRDSLTHRRFFEIADLIGIRQEIAGVFEDSHALILRLARERRLDGIRIDHIDGVADPKGYVETLREAFHAIRRSPSIHVEKILTGDERLRPDWAIDGSTGYTFIAALGGLFVDETREAPMTAAYQAFTGEAADIAGMLPDIKRRILTDNLAAELAHLGRLAGAVAERDLATRDFGPDTLARAITEVAAALPVYRTYVSTEGVGRADADLIAGAVAEAVARGALEPEAPIRFVGRLLTLDFGEGAAIAGAHAFARRFQQTTGAVMAKSLEDTAFYRFNRLIALNEVGNEPDRYGIGVEAFHTAMLQRGEDQPNGLSATATHDTKRGEDARARLYTLSEAPDRWAEAVRDCAERMAPFRRDLGAGRLSPDPVTEWGLYQSLLGVLPPDFDPTDADACAAIAERLVAYAEKAVREAKRFTSWTAPDEAYEEGVRAFVRAMLEPARSGSFLESFWATARPFVAAGALTSLAQTVLKVAAPGVPDIYQGTELYDLSLVDPDNRRPVDFDARVRISQTAAAPAALLDTWRDGRVNAAVLKRALAVRQRQPGLFTAGAYRALTVRGPLAKHVVAFARADENGQKALAVVPRLALTLLDGREDGIAPPPEVWAGTTVELDAAALADSDWRDAFTGARHAAGESLALEALFCEMPVALLEAE